MEVEELISRLQNLALGNPKALVQMKIEVASLPENAEDVTCYVLDVEKRKGSRFITLYGPDLIDRY